MRRLKELLQILLLLIGAFTAGAPLLAADAAYRGEFVRRGDEFLCGVENVKPEDMGRLSGRWCLHMGGLAIGDKASAASFLGKPAQVIPGEKSATNQVFFLERPDAVPYLVVTVASDRIVALQVTGNAPAGAWSFNRVQLGSTEQDLIGILGEPMSKDPREGYDHWSYYPWPFSFEIAEGRVTSIRINDRDS